MELQEAREVVKNDPDYQLDDTLNRQGLLTGKKQEQFLRDQESYDLDAVRLLKIDNFDPHIGTVLCTSGTGRNVGGYLMDWGLVELDPRRLNEFDSLSSVCIHYRSSLGTVPY